MKKRSEEGQIGGQLHAIQDEGEMEKTIFRRNLSRINKSEGNGGKEKQEKLDKKISIGIAIALSIEARQRTKS